MIYTLNIFQNLTQWRIIIAIYILISKSYLEKYNTSEDFILFLELFPQKYFIFINIYSHRDMKCRQGFLEFQDMLAISIYEAIFFI